MADTLPPLPAGAKEDYFVQESSIPELPRGATKYDGADINSRFPKYSPPTDLEKARAFGYGAGVGYLGTAGDVEKAVFTDIPRYVKRKVTGREEDESPGVLKRMTGRETIFPTSEEFRQTLGKVGISRPREEVRGWETAGEFAPAAIGLAEGAYKAGVKALATTPARESAARFLESKGIKLSPAQVRSVEPIPQKGAKSILGSSESSNQKIANQLASETTGVKVDNISDSFLNGRFKALGKDFDQIYKGKWFKIDDSALNALSAMSQTEKAMPGVSRIAKVDKTASDILKSQNELRNQVARTGRVIPNTFEIRGDALQRIRSEIKEAARGAQPAEARELYKLVDAIDESIARHHPDAARNIRRVSELYRNTMELDNLRKIGGIRGGQVSLDQLGNMIVSREGAKSVAGSELSKLGQAGKELQLRAMWEKAGSSAFAAEHGLSQLTGMSKDLASRVAFTRSGLARAMQRYASGSSYKEALELERQAMKSGLPVSEAVKGDAEFARRIGMDLPQSSKREVLKKALRIPFSTPAQLGGAVSRQMTRPEEE